MRLARAAALAVALVICAAFVVGIRQAHDTAAATSILSQTAPLTAAQAQRAAGLTRSAQTLNPDREPTILRGRLALAQGHPAQARALLYDVIHAEPDNIEPYVWYLRASADNARAYVAAVIGINRLMPAVKAKK